MKYKQLKKNIRYSYQYKNKVKSGTYLGRFFNKEIKSWMYHFEICFGMYQTIPCDKTKVLL